MAPRKTQLSPQPKRLTEETSRLPKEKFTGVRNIEEVGTEMALLAEEATTSLHGIGLLLRDEDYVRMLDFWKRGGMDYMFTLGQQHGLKLTHSEILHYVGLMAQGIIRKPPHQLPWEDIRHYILGYRPEAAYTPLQEAPFTKWDKEVRDGMSNWMF